MAKSTDDQGGLVSVKVGAELKAELRGEVPSDSLGRALDAITDFASPVTKYMGLLGDRLQLQREEVLLEVARRAKARIEFQGGTTHDIPPKLVTALLEHASKEAPEDDVLIDMWANLLATAATQRVEMMSQYIAVLSGSTSLQVSLLDKILTVDGGGFSVDEYLDVYYSIGPADVERTISAISAKTSEDFADAVFDALSFAGVAIDCINVSSGRGHDDYVTLSADDRVYEDERFFDFQNLCRMGVMDHVQLRMKKIGKFTVDVIYYIATPVGADLFACCNPTKATRSLHQTRALAI